MCNFVCISWYGVMSDYFCAINGVKQGGVLSPGYSAYIYSGPEVFARLASR